VVRTVQFRRALGAAFTLALLAPAAAEAHVRHTTPVASATSGTCSAALPCRIDHAINAANAGDEVVVAPGTYAITIPLDAPAIDLHGVAGQPAPLLAGDTNLSGDVLTFEDGGTVRHLSLRGDSPAWDTLSLENGLAEDLTITAVTGDSGKVTTADGTTVLRDSTVVTQGTGSSGDALKLREGSGGSGALALRNVTVLATGGIAIRCEVSSSRQASLVNVIARGDLGDVNAANGGDGCSASHSNLRPASSPGLALGAGIQSADPLLGADLRPLAGSPAIDAGAADAHTSPTDPDGRARTVPDIGAFEGTGAPAPVVQPTPTPTATATPVLPVRGVPELGETVLVAPGQGKVLVRRPGTRRFRKLGTAALLPSGTVVDARRGRIRLTSALDEEGTTQTGRFWGARFEIRQGHKAQGMTSLTLRGGDFGACPARSSGLARTSGVARDPARRVVRSLWARDRGGRFRTYGNNSVATARGTAWVTRDRCDGTVTRVAEGAVAVKDRRTGRTVVVRAGDRHLARR